MAARYWENGVPIQIVLMEQDKITHKVFVSTVLGMSVDRYASIVNAKVSSGLSRPPIKVSSQIKMIDTINKISGAIGYVSPGYIIYKDQYENIKFISIEADYE
jgi:ABC-type phosphate transport system substrate-binding protein